MLMWRYTLPLNLAARSPSPSIEMVLVAKDVAIGFVFFSSILVNEKYMESEVTSYKEKVATLNAGVI